MAKKKVVFLGSKPIGYECLAYAIARQDALGMEITGVLTNNRKEFGSGHDLVSLATANGISVISSLDQLPDCDIIYSVQYHEILKAQHISKARQVAVNLHMAPLPEYRGSNQFTFAILEGKEEFGTTIHLMQPGVDNGDILFQKRFAIAPDWWVKDLYDKTYDASINLFRQTLKHIVEGQFKPVPQQLLVGKYGTSMHYRKEMAALKVIDLNWDKEKIQRHVRATSMPGFEPPYCFIDGKKVYFTTIDPTNKG